MAKTVLSLYPFEDELSAQDTVSIQARHMLIIAPAVFCVYSYCASNAKYPLENTEKICYTLTVKLMTSGGIFFAAA
jgi:hypothetical protein